MHVLYTCTLDEVNFMHKGLHDKNSLNFPFNTQRNEFVSVWWIDNQYINFIKET